MPTKWGAALLNPNYTIFNVSLQERLQVASYRKLHFIFAFQIPHSILSTGKLSRHSPYPVQLFLMLNKTAAITASRAGAELCCCLIVHGCGCQPSSSPVVANSGNLTWKTDVWAKAKGGCSKDSGREAGNQLSV